MHRISTHEADRIRARVHAVIQGKDRTVAREVLDRVHGRLADMEVGVEPTQRRKVATAGSRARVTTLRTEIEEVLIMRAVAMTGHDRQFGVTPKAEVFASRSHGYTHEDQRVYVTNLSPLIADIGWEFNLFREGEGGRFYESNGTIVDAHSHLRVLRIEY